MRLRIPVLTFLLSALSWAPVCTGLDTEPGSSASSSSGEGAEEGETGPRLDRVRYTLAWAWGRAEAGPNGGWVTENDRGDRVSITRGFLTSYSLSLVACSDVVARRDSDSAPSGLARLGELFGARRAWAGHPGAVNPSTSPAPIVEVLDVPLDDELVVDFDAESYCRVHYLVARAHDASLGLPEEPDLIGTSLYLEGTVTRPDGSVETLLVDTSIAYGSLTDFALEGAGTSATVRVTRHLDTLFDGVDFDAEDERDVARQIVTNVVSQAAIEVVVE